MVWSLSEHVSFISLCQMNIHAVHMYEWAYVCVCVFVFKQVTMDYFFLIPCVGNYVENVSGK